MMDGVESYEYADADEPLARGAAADEDPAEPDLEHDLFEAVQAEFRESAILPGVPLN
jgi:hypothetical protein